MNIPTKTLSNGFELPVYGMGMWLMGGKREVDTSNDERDIAAIRTAIDLGVTHFDTAEGYAAGHSEELLGQAVKGYDRGKLIIATKVSGEHQSYEGVHASFTASLKRLDMEYVDLYLLHTYPDPGIPIEETMRAMNELVDSGKVRHIGVCNMTPRRFEAAQAASKHTLVLNQVHYNVQYREVEARGVIQHAQDNDVFAAAWRPVQKGELADNPLMTELAEKYGKTTTQIAINWLVSQKNVVTIAKTSSKEHLVENLGALDFTLSDEDIERIRHDYPDQKFVSDAVPLDYAADVPA